MLIAEELLLLSIDDETGRNALLSNDKIAPALGGALLVELALMERIGVTPASAERRQRGRVTITSTTPTDDQELDNLMVVLEQREGAKVTDLISQMSMKPITKGLRDRLLHRLARAGVLREQRSAIFKIRSWPTIDPGPRHEVHSRLQAALVRADVPSERTVALIALLNATGRLSKVVVGEDKKTLKSRARDLSKGDWAAEAVKRAINEVTDSSG
ncbi:MAG TPA: GPP34 family phosphoprotein [Microlunatus sp.]|nr:GPP34 family phosphoprotein [Microlunatus sp.]